MELNFHDGPHVTPSLMKKGGYPPRKGDNHSGIFTVKIWMAFCLVLLVSSTVYAGPGPGGLKSFKKCHIQVTDFTADPSQQVPKWAVRQLADTLASFLDAYYHSRFLSVYRTGHFEKKKSYLKVVGRISRYTGPNLGWNYPVEAPITILDNISMKLSLKIVLGPGNRQLGNLIEVEYMMGREDEWEIGPLEDLIVMVAKIAAIQIGEEKYRQ